MEKIESLFLRNEDHSASDEVNPKCLWVYDPPRWTASVKMDGSACLIHRGRFYRRYKLKEEYPIPVGWLHHTFNSAQVSGHGWLPVRVESPQDRYHLQAWHAMDEDGEDGTYELVGPKVNGNPYRLEECRLFRHGHESVTLYQLPKNPDQWCAFFLEAPAMEGIVFRHEDGRYAKIKARDVGAPWPVRQKS